MSRDSEKANPYRSPKSGAEDVGTPSGTPAAERVEKAIILSAVVYMAVYVPYFFVQLYRISQGVDVSPLAIFPAHFLGMALNFTALAVTIRDLYLRPFPNPNAKLTWLLLILMTGGIGWIVYVFKYALKPRTNHRGSS